MDHLGATWQAGDFPTAMSSSLHKFNATAQYYSIMNDRAPIGSGILEFNVSGDSSGAARREGGGGQSGPPTVCT